MSASPTGNARGFTRVGVRLELALDTGGQGCIEGRIRDLSASGLFIEAAMDAAPTIGSECGVTLDLGGGGAAVIRARARVVRVEAAGIALTITEVEGEDSFVHLRNLVLYNTADADTALAEFDAHVGLKHWE